MVYNTQMTDVQFVSIGQVRLIGREGWVFCASQEIGWDWKMIFKMTYEYTMCCEMLKLAYYC